MGMTLEQFWDGSPYLVLTYRKAFKIKKELDNEMAWLTGLYFYGALSVSLYNVFKEHGQKRKNYLEKPLDIFPLTPAEKKRREHEEMLKTQKTLEQMMAAQKARKKKSEAKSPKKEVSDDGRRNGKT